MLARGASWCWTVGWGSICLETTPGEALAAGRGCPVPARASPQLAQCGAKPYAAKAPMGPQHCRKSGLEVFQSRSPSSRGI